MAKAIDITEEQLAFIRTRRAEGAPWHSIASDLGIGRNRVIDAGRAEGLVESREWVKRFSHRKGAGALALAGVVDDEAEAEAARDRRVPLAAGSAVTWGAITRGTMLDGARFEPMQPLVGRVGRSVAQAGTQELAQPAGNTGIAAPPGRPAIASESGLEVSSAA